MKDGDFLSLDNIADVEVTERPRLESTWENYLDNLQQAFPPENVCTRIPDGLVVKTVIRPIE